jgi:hypothetical protein
MLAAAALLVSAMPEHPLEAAQEQAPPVADILVPLLTYRTRPQVLLVAIRVVRAGIRAARVPVVLHRVRRSRHQGLIAPSGVSLAP